MNIQYYSYIQSGDRNYAEVEVSHFVTAAQGKGLLQKLLSYPTVQEAQVQPVPHPTVDGPCRFSDVPQNHPFYEEITWLEYRNITTGWADGTYRPQDAVTREAMAAFFYRYAGKPDYVVVGPVFKDVPHDGAFYREINWLRSNGITTGWPMAPTALVSRFTVTQWLRLSTATRILTPKSSAYYTCRGDILTGAYYREPTKNVASYSKSAHDERDALTAPA